MPGDPRNRKSWSKALMTVIVRGDGALLLFGENTDGLHMALFWN